MTAVEHALKTTIEDRRRDAHSSGYWTTLRPTFPGKQSASEHGRGFELELRSGLEEHGYAHLEAILDRQRVEELLGLGDAVRSVGWPPVWSFVYDEPWALARDTLRPIAEVALDGPVALIPHLAVHYVSAAGESKGWHPHVDGRGRANRLTTWVPLTDATLANGCMYIVPRSSDESVNRAVAHYANRKMSVGDVQRLLQHARALPAAPGSVLCWGFGLLHWGSVHGGGAEPRVSIAYEWIADGEAPHDDELPTLLLDDELPSFAERLRFIARAIRAYHGFDATLEPFQALADEILEED